MFRVRMELESPHAATALGGCQGLGHVSCVPDLHGLIVATRDEQVWHVWAGLQCTNAGAVLLDCLLSGQALASVPGSDSANARKVSKRYDQRSRAGKPIVPRVPDAEHAIVPTGVHDIG